MNHHAAADLRARAARLLATLVWANLVVVALVAWAVDGPLVWVAAIGLGLAVVSEAMLRLAPDAARITIAIALMGQAALGTAAFAGHPWQVDSHMAFFALLAGVALMDDAVAVLVAAVVVALHHLVLNFALPSLVYPGGGDFGRTLMHAVILVAETVALVLSILARDRLTARVAETAAAAERALDQARAGEAAAAAAKAQADRVREDLNAEVEAAFSSFVDSGLQGVFDIRIERSFEDPTMAGLAGRMNELYALIDRTLSAMEAQLSAMAEGDLTRTVALRADGRFRDIEERINASVGELRDLVGGITEATDTTRAVSARIARTSTDLADRNATQASSIQETSAAMEQFAVTVQGNSDRLGEANDLAQTLGRRTGEGSEAVKRAVSAVEKIEQSSNKITEIISVIDAIAFQTNLLALNAAVEAARAGDAGKGFAVVASEVRTLAQRSSAAARDISTLIQESTSNVASGVKMVQETGEALEGITGALATLTDTIASVASAGREQAEGIGEMKQAIRQMEEITQANVGLVDETSSAAGALESGVGQLATLVGRFTTGRPAPSPEPAQKAAELRRFSEALAEPSPKRALAPRTAPVRAAAPARPAPKAARPSAPAKPAAPLRPVAAATEEDWSQF